MKGRTCLAEVEVSVMTPDPNRKQPPTVTWERRRCRKYARQGGYCMQHWSQRQRKVKA